MKQDKTDIILFGAKMNHDTWADAYIYSKVN